jgi:hypothetical protein
MSGDPFQFWQQLNKASTSAFIATPAVYRIMDQFASMYDSLSNSSSLSPNSAMTEVKQLNLSQKMQDGVLAGVESKITGVLQAGIIQSFFGEGPDPITAKARQAAQQEQVKAIIETTTAKIENRLQLLAKIMYENALADEQTKQLNKLAGSDMASINGYSDEKINAMDDLANTVVQEPDDLEINA